MITLLVRRLLSNGHLIVAQTIPRYGQRLYALVDWSDVPADLAKKVKAAEEAIYNDKSDPLVNWDERDLETALQKAGLAQVRLQVEKQVEQRQITAERLARWFSQAVVSGQPDSVASTQDERRPSYGHRLLDAGLTPAECDQIAALYHHELLNEDVAWHTVIAYIEAAR